MSTPDKPSIRKSKRISRSPNSMKTTSKISQVKVNTEFSELNMDIDNDNNGGKEYCNRSRIAALQKIFHDLDRKMCNTKVNNVKLMKYITDKVDTKSEYLRYNFVDDHNVYNLKFMIFLLIEEVETIIKNIDGKSGMSHLLELDKKLERRSGIINYLLKEKMILSKFITKILSVIEFTETSLHEFTRRLGKTKAFPGKQGLIDLASHMKNDFSHCDKFKDFVKEYFSDTDYKN